MPVTKKDLEIIDQNDTIKEDKETLRKESRIPNVRMFNKVTVYAHQVSHNRFRYSLTSSPVYPEAWKKEMSGTEAVQLFRKIQRNNRLGKLESKGLPE